MAEVATGGLAGKIFGVLVAVLEVLWLQVRIYAEVFRGVYLTLVPPPEKSVAGEVVLVTGAGHGIGREVALKYGSLGATVVCMDINEKGAAETAKDIKGMGVKSAAYKCDVSNRDEVLAVAKKITQEVGPVTVLVNNAGIMPTKPFLEHTPEEIERIFDINMLAHCWLLQAFLPSMMERKHGHVVAVSSMCGQAGTTNLAPYCASKYAVRGFMESLAVEQYDLRPDLVDKVRFTTIYPYMVNTGLVKSHSVRFGGFMPILNPAEVGAEIVSAMRRNETEVSVPGWMFHFFRFMRLYPTSVAFMIRDYLQVKIEGEKK
ncbi:17-beta-hydroxysteroid dehydrogenase 13-like [Thrips palmi]|uniref:Short-chain dehydrogenase/reductase 3 n=1 Tax=Thrips palmi TaxID=161013 RepID=A0A6P9A4T7_THRPL|nr:17-beta-hydroxysteroid dehydrogenase 13-like [Thrips palmi]XP_034252872.1 17-beta-hydroxysteroid dehydrogenase 13-like [Thrips palmi]